MKINRNNKDGGAAIALLLFAMIIPLLVASYAFLSANNQKATQHAVLRMEAQVIAENIAAAAGASFYQELKQNPTIHFATLEDRLKETMNWIRIQNISLSGVKIDEGYEMEILDFTCSRIARTNQVDLVIAVSNNRTGVKVGLLVSYKVVEVSFLDYAIFSDGIFELAPWPKMDIYGDVRVNDLIRIGARDKLRFHDTIFTSDRLDVIPAWGRSEANNAQRLFTKASDGTLKSFYTDKVLDSENPNWEVDSTARWGEDRVQTSGSSLQVPSSATDNHVLIEPRDVANDDSSLEREKLAWKAARPGGVMITVASDGSVSYEKNGNGVIKPALPKVDLAVPKSKDPSTGVYKLTRYTVGGKKVRGWVEVDDTFQDGRETSKGVRVVNIYMDRLIKKFPAENLFYVQVEDEDANLTPYLEAKQNNASLKLPAVRIRNGHNISATATGLTVATHRMAYIEGNFNKVNKISALVAADNVTVLSNGWKDSNKSTKRPGGTLDTYYNAAFLVGGYTYNPDAPSKSIEGFQNLVRYRENWGGLNKTFYYDGSYVKLFNSKETKGAANSPWFRAPDRVITYNSDFVEHPPPGMPTALASPEVVIWREVSWAEAQALVE